MRRPAGAALILAGSIVLIVQVRVLDDVIASLTWGRGIHLSDILGLILVASGTMLIWRA
ncbi:MAG: hypothetical protein ACRDLK_07110 [Gaiellaceae bacterium]